jgi:leader peptidase (prepilin peptidase) / N-methyltransferase
MFGYIFLIFLLGILAGYLVNYLADVLPCTLRLSRPACPNPHCLNTFAWKDYLLMRSCRKCSKRRSVRSFITPIVCISSSVFLWYFYPLKLGYYLGFFVLSYLITVAIIDLEHRLILRSLSIAGGIIAAISGVLLHGWLVTLMGGIIGFSIMFLFYLGGRWFTRQKARRTGQDPSKMEEALGSGDVTLATILGLLLGWPLIWFGLLMGALLGGMISLVIITVVIVLQRKHKEQALMTFFPLGPAYILSAVLLVYFPTLIGRFLPGQ